MRFHHNCVRLFSPIRLPHPDELVFLSILVVCQEIPDTFKRIWVQIRDVVDVRGLWVAFVVEHRQYLVVAPAFVRCHYSADDFTADHCSRMDGIFAQDDDV